MSASAEEFRQVAGRYVTGVVVITTVADGVAHAMTSNSFTSVSLDPLLALFCVERGARFHEAVLASGFWNVSILGEDAEPAARWFSTRGRPLAGQFDDFAHRPGAGGAPLLEEAVGWLECRTERIHPAGDHDIVVGQVTGIPEPGAGTGGALAYWRSTFRRIG